MLFFRLTLLLLSLLASSDAQTLDRYDVLAQTDERFNQFENKLKDYLLDSKDTGKKTPTLEDKKEIKKIVEESNLLFLKLREKVRDIIFSERGNYPDTNSEVIDAESEMTKWYVGYLEAFLFSVSPIAVGMEDQTQDIISHMEKDFTQFKKNLEYFFSYLDALAIKYKDNAYGRLLNQNKEEMKKQMEEANEIFLELRQKFRKMSLARYHNDENMTLNTNWIESEITSWYIVNITSRFFPEDWDTLFKSFLNKKEQ